MKTAKVQDVTTTTEENDMRVKSGVTELTVFALSEKAVAIAERPTLQAPAKGLGKGWRQAGHKAPSLRHGAIQAIVKASKRGVITEEDALAALAGVPLGAGTPRSFFKAFVEQGYLVDRRKGE
jgi:hypothetical protein